jgi:hypothetical protein
MRAGLWRFRRHDGAGLTLLYTFAAGVHRSTRTSAKDWHINGALTKRALCERLYDTHLHAGALCRYCLVGIQMPASHAVHCAGHVLHKRWNGYACSCLCQEHFLQVRKLLTAYIQLVCLLLRQASLSAWIGIFRDIPAYGLTAVSI